jgi:hypothetical protein
MLLRSVSILATVVLMAAAAALVFRGAILGTGPVSISLQLLASGVRGVCQKDRANSSIRALMPETLVNTKIPGS